jgi:hypothetical protein
MKSVGVYLPDRILANFLSSDFANFLFGVDTTGVYRHWAGETGFGFLLIGVTGSNTCVVNCSLPSHPVFHRGRCCLDQ